MAHEFIHFEMIDARFRPPAGEVGLDLQDEMAAGLEEAEQGTRLGGHVNAVLVHLVELIMVPAHAAHKDDVEACGRDLVKNLLAIQLQIGRAAEMRLGVLDAGLRDIDSRHLETEIVKEGREKPDAATAESYVADGGCFWNSGIFVLHAATLLKELETLAPDILDAARPALERAQEDLGFLRLDAEAFAALARLWVSLADIPRITRTDALRFLRLLENRLRILRDMPLEALPTDDDSRPFLDTVARRMTLTNGEALLAHYGSLTWGVRERYLRYVGT